jgi:hypothetical protein
MIMVLQLLFLISFFVVTSVYAPPHETHAKNATRWTHGNHKAKRQSAEFAAAVNLRAKRSSLLLLKQGTGTRKYTRKQRMAFKKKQIELEGMLEEIQASRRLIQAEMVI